MLHTLQAVLSQPMNKGPAAANIITNDKGSADAHNAGSAPPGAANSEAVATHSWAHRLASSCFSMIAGVNDAKHRQATRPASPGQAAGLNTLFQLCQAAAAAVSVPAPADAI